MNINISSSTQPRGHSFLCGLSHRSWPGGKLPPAAFGRWTEKANGHSSEDIGNLFARSAASIALSVPLSLSASPLATTKPIWESITVGCVDCGICVSHRKLVKSRSAAATNFPPKRLKRRSPACRSVGATVLFRRREEPSAFGF